MGLACKLRYFLNKIIYSSKQLSTVTGNNTLLAATVSLQPMKDLSPTTLFIKNTYFAAFEDYAITTEVYRKKKILTNLLGRSYYFGFDQIKQRVALIYVSKKFGRWHDPQVSVIKRTISGLSHTLTNTPASIEIHCNKLNSDNFDIPWPDMEKEITKLLQQFPKHKMVVHND